MLIFVQIYDKWEAAEWKLEMLHCMSPNCHSTFFEELLHDLRNDTIERNIFGVFFYEFKQLHCQVD